MIGQLFHSAVTVYVVIGKLGWGAVYTFGCSYTYTCPSSGYIPSKMPNTHMHIVYW